MAHLFPYPGYTSWERWAAEVVAQNPDLSNQLGSLAWDEFARRLALVIPQAPHPMYFDTWQAWATALRRATNS